MSAYTTLQEIPFGRYYQLDISVDGVVFGTSPAFHSPNDAEAWKAEQKPRWKNRRIKATLITLDGAAFWKQRHLAR